MGRTFKEVFSEGALVKLGPGDYLLMGFTGQKSLDWKIAEKNIRFAQRSSNATFADYKFLSWLVVTEDLDNFFGNGPLHTDNRPRLEFSAPKKLYGSGPDHARNLDRIIDSRRRLTPDTLKFQEFRYQ